MIKALLTSKRFYITIGTLIVLGAVLLFALDAWLMPAYTNYKEGLTVPDVRKVSLDEAKETLTDYGLRYEVVERRNHPSYPTDFILEQSPDPTQIVKPNRKVYLTVTTSVQPQVMVPDVTDLSLRNARIQLQNYGLTVGTISYVSSRFKNTVLRQSISGDTRVEKGAVIDLTVSDGLGVDMVKIPEITGLRLTEAQNKLSEAGLRVGEITFEPNKEYSPNVVLGYSPSGNDSIVVGSTLQLTVSERFEVEEETESGPVIIDSTENQNASPDAVPDTTPAPIDTTNLSPR